MSNLYDKYLDEFDAAEGPLLPSEEALDAATDSLAFVQALHTMFKENGVDLPESPDISNLENLIDGVIGELAAASIFLSEPSFKSVPEMLRMISSSFAQEPGEEVPTVITKGFSRLADRIEATRIQTIQMKDLAAQTDEPAAQVEDLVTN